MSSARIIAREISAYQPVQIVKILAHRNGYGRNNEGVLMVGSTVRGVCTGNMSRYNFELCVVYKRAPVVATGFSI